MLCHIEGNLLIRLHPALETIPAILRIDGSAPQCSHDIEICEIYSRGSNDSSCYREAGVRWLVQSLGRTKSEIAAGV